MAGQKTMMPVPSPGKPVRTRLNTSRLAEELFMFSLLGMRYFVLAAGTCIVACSRSPIVSTPMPQAPRAPAASSATAQHAYAVSDAIHAPEVQSEFTADAANIGCTYTPRGGTGVYMPRDGGPELSCDRVSPKYVRAVLGPAGPAELITRVGDASCCVVTHELKEGERLSRGPFTCEFTRAALTCLRTDGQGFVLSKDKLEVSGRRL